MVPNHQYRYSSVQPPVQAQQKQLDESSAPSQYSSSTITNGMSSSVNHRSLSEPRHHANKTTTNLPPPPPPAQNFDHHQVYNPIQTNTLGYKQNIMIDEHSSAPSDHQNFYVQQPSGKEVQNGTISSAETYDNLNDNSTASSGGPPSHQSRIESKYNQVLQQQQHQQQQSPQLHFYERYNATLRPHYHSMRVPNGNDRDIKSVDRDILYNFYNQQSKLMAKPSQNGYAMPAPPSVKNNHQNNMRDIKSCDRDFSIQTSISNSTAPVIISPVSTNGTTLNDLQSRSRSGSITPRHQQYEADMTEDDAITTSSSICYEMNGKAKKAKKDDFDLDEDLSSVAFNQNEENELLNSLDENDIENFETSKIKMKLMQKQLQTLTSLVHQALINRDLNQLAQFNMQNLQAQSMNMIYGNGVKPNKTNGHAKMGKMQSQNGKAETKELRELNEKTKSLKNDLNSLKKLQENLNSSFGNSIKTFVQQLNEKLKSFCLNEINEKIKLDLVLYKYQIDSSKIENELG